MCEQCVAEVELWELFSGESTDELDLTYSGWALIRATKDGLNMSKGDWGLVRVNDPDVIFETTPMVDPSENMSDEDVDNLSAEDYQKVENFFMKLSEFRNELVLSPYDGHLLVEKAKQNGYSDNDNFDYWLFNKLGKLIKNKPDMVHKDGLDH